MGDESTRIRSFDFRLPDKFSKEQLRTLSVLHDNVARRWASHCAGAFRLPTQVAVSRVEQAACDDILRRDQDGTLLALLSLPPLRGQAVLMMDIRLGLAVIDRLFGGPGKWEGASRGLTDVERAAVTRVLQGLADVLAGGWTGLVELEPRVDRVEDNPLFVQSLAGSEAGAAVSFQVSLGGQEGKLCFFLPYFMLEPLLPRLNTQAWADRYRQGSHAGTGQVNHRLRQAPVSLSVVLGQATLAMRQAVALKPGDVLRLNSPVDGLLPLTVEGKPLFLGQAGRCGTRLAFRIVCRPGLEEESNGYCAEQGPAE
jgi:flagellar motor switch protein FliM